MLLAQQVKKKIADVEGALNGTRNYLGITEPVSGDRAKAKSGEEAGAGFPAEGVPASAIHGSFLGTRVR